MYCVTTAEGIKRKGYDDPVQGYLSYIKYHAREGKRRKARGLRQSLRITGIKLSGDDLLLSRIFCLKPYTLNHTPCLHILIFFYIDASRLCC